MNPLSVFYNLKNHHPRALVRLAALAAALLALSVFPGATAVAGADFEAYLQPEEVAPGESFRIVLESDQGEIDLLEAPDLTYQGVSQSTQIINGQRSASKGYAFAAPDTPGTYPIGPLSVKIAGKTEKMPVLTLKVVPPEAIGNIGEEDFFARVTLGNAPDNAPAKPLVAYAGETIPLTIHFFYRDSERVQLDLGYPELNLGNVLRRDYRRLNPEHPEFAVPETSRRNVDGVRFQIVTFRTAFQTLAPGKLTLQGVIPCSLLIPEDGNRSGRRSGDLFESFFNTTPYRKVQRNITLEIPAIEVKALPTPPRGMTVLNVVGDCSVTGTLEDVPADQVLKTGDAITYQIVLKENDDAGALETLRAPKLEFEGFRTYPAEVARETLRNGKSVVTLRYVMIPLRPGELTIHSNIGIFQPQSADYVATALERKFRVVPGMVSEGGIPAENNLTSAPPTAGSNAATSSTPPQQQPRTQLLYLKNAPSGTVSHSWTYQIRWYLLFFLCFGPAVLLGMEAHRRVTQEHRSNLAWQRKRQAGSRQKNLLQELQKLPEDEIPIMAAQELFPYWSDLWNLHPGATAGEIADAVPEKDTELKAAIRKCGELSYLPPELVKLELKEPESLRQTLLRGLKRYTLLLLSGAIFLLCGNTFGANDDTATAAAPSWSAAIQAFDRGEYRSAQEFFLNTLRENGQDAAVLYNLGCIAEAERNNPLALSYFERALRLAPRDWEIRENCNVLRRRLLQSERQNPDSPRQLLKTWRDRFRPDEYLLGLSILWSLVFLVIAFRRKMPLRIQLFLLGAIVLAAFLLTLGWATQRLDSYRSDQAMILVPQATLYSLPGETHRLDAAKLSGGSKVQLLERRKEFDRIRDTATGVDAWVKSADLTPLLPNE